MTIKNQLYFQAIGICSFLEQNSQKGEFFVCLNYEKNFVKKHIELRLNKDMSPFQIMEKLNKII